MKLKKSITIIIIITIVLLCGCQEQNISNNQKIFENIKLESSLVELVNASLNFIKDDDIITRVDVKYLFHNIAGREITITINVEFYDINDNLINRSQLKYISLLTDYTEKEFAPDNIISYSGEDVNEVDHVKIVVKE